MRALCTSVLLVALSSSTWAVSVQIYPMSAPRCVYPTGALGASANGGVGPYSYQWSNGSTAAQIYDLPAGTYSVTVTDFNGEQASDQFTLVAEPLGIPSAFWLPGCPADSGLPTKRLLAYYSLNTFGMEPFSQGSVISGLADDYVYFGPSGPGGAGEVLNFEITDANGCGTEIELFIPADPVWPIPQVLAVDGSCSNGANGSISIFVPAEANGWSTGIRLYRENGLLVPWAGTTGTVPFNGGNFLANGLTAGTYHIVNVVDWGNENALLNTVFLGIDEACRDTLTVVVPDLGFTCGTLTGRAFIDANENCTQNGGEPNLQGTIIEVEPGPFYALTNSSGQYSMNLPYGTYTVNTVNPLYQEHCGVSTSPFSLSAVQPALTRNLPDTSLVGLDVSVMAGSGAARPGFEVAYAIDLKNLTGVLSGVASVTMTFDPNLTYLSSIPSPASVVGNTITWNTPSLAPFQFRSFRPRFQVPPDITLLGTVLTSTITGSVANPEADLSNNTYEHEVIVTGAYDPNDKLAQTSSRTSTSSYFIADDEWIDYTIRFQNTGTDTAFFVVITDTLPPNLDPGTFQAGVGSHNHSVQLLGQGILRWSFPNIMLPDSNINEPLSHGFVTFRIRPRLPLLPGDEIENIANIYFDYNPPVITEPSVLVATTGTGVADTGTGHVLHIFPNPADQLLTIVLPDASGPLWIEVHALDGRLVTAERAQGSTHSLSLEHLTMGAYIIQVRDAFGTAHHNRFIKQ
jgi:uncharacterized repeat protein (TIGR01451 family)